MKYLLVALATSFSYCTRSAPPAPVPAPVVVIEAGPSGPPSCDSAYTHQIDMGCPPEEDAYGGWVFYECSKYSVEQIVCINEASTCAAARGCVEP